MLQILTYGCNGLSAFPAWQRKRQVRLGEEEQRFVRKNNVWRESFCCEGTFKLLKKRKILISLLRMSLQCAHNPIPRPVHTTHTEMLVVMTMVLEMLLSGLSPEL